MWRVFTTQAWLVNVPMWESSDLVTWRFVADVLPVLPQWAGWGATWAPDAVEIDGSWLLYFSALYGETDLHCVGHAVASEASGPFTPFEEPLVCDLGAGGAIDPMVFIDRADGPHLLWKVDANAIGGQSRLMAQPLSDDGQALVREPAELLRYEGGWEWPLIEQPEVIEHDGQLHLFYAAGWYNTANYQVGHAVCRDLHSRCERSSSTSGWLTTSGTVEGPGALSLEAHGDVYAAVYHAWVDGDAGAATEFRSMVVDRFTIVDGLPVSALLSELAAG